MPRSHSAPSHEALWCDAHWGFGAGATSHVLSQRQVVVCSADGVDVGRDALLARLFHTPIAIGHLP